jgi:hypothetical protein
MCSSTAPGELLTAFRKQASAGREKVPPCLFARPESASAASNAPICMHCYRTRVGRPAARIFRACRRRLSPPPVDGSGKHDSRARARACACACALRHCRVHARRLGLLWLPASLQQSCAHSPRPLSSRQHAPAAVDHRRPSPPSAPPPISETVAFSPRSRRLC